MTGVAPVKSLSPGDRRGVVLVNLYDRWGHRIESRVAMPSGRFTPKGKPHIVVRGGRRGLRLVSPD